MPTKEQFEYARAQLEYHARKGNIDKYTILPNAATGRLEVTMSFSFDPKERCLQVFRLTPPASEERCRIYDAECVDPTKCKAADACCAGEVTK